MGLPAHMRRILLLLDGNDGGGFITRDVSRGVGCSGHRGSADVRVALLALQRLGYVEDADGKKPIVWRITDAGHVALKAATPTP